MANRSIAGVQLQGCAALASFGAMSDGDELEADLLGAGGFDAVLAAMGVHGTSAGVQEQGCKALVNLALHDANEAAILRAGGIEAVVAGMRAHRSSERVQEEDCMALLHLARSGVSRRWWRG